jgi:hypothetical protein
VPWIFTLASVRQFLLKRRVHKINTLFIIDVMQWAAGIIIIIVTLLLISWQIQNNELSEKQRWSDLHTVFLVFVWRRIRVILERGGHPQRSKIF